MSCLCLKKKKKKEKISRNQNSDAAERSARLVWPAPASPLPLPSPVEQLPLHQNSRSSGRRTVVGQPLPPVPVNPGALLDFDYMSQLCNHFSPRSQSVFRCSIPDNAGVHKAVDVILLQPKENLTGKLKRLTELEHPNVCRLIGYSLSDKDGRGLIVAEALEKCTLREVLLKRSAFLDWKTRLQIAVSAAEGLLFLHQSSPLLQVELGASNILLSRKKKSELDVKVELTVLEENSERRRQANIRAYGIVLLEIVTGKCDVEAVVSTDKRRRESFVRWGRRMLSDSVKLSTLLDAKLLLHCPLPAARNILNLALNCLDNLGPLPTMQQVIRVLQEATWMKKVQVLDRSATFAYSSGSNMGSRDSTPPPRSQSTSGSWMDWQPAGTRSAGASPARRLYIY